MADGLPVANQNINWQVDKMISIEQATQTRIALFEAGFCPLLVCRETPCNMNWQRLASNVDEAVFLSRKSILMQRVLACYGHLTVIDVDVTKPELIKPIKESIHTITGATPPERIGCPPKTAFFFRSETSMRKKVSKRYGSELVQDQQIEVLGQGQCVVTHNIHPATNQLYRWPNIDLVNCTHNSLPQINQSQVSQIISAAEQIMSSAGLVSKQDITTREKNVFATMKRNGYDEISTEQMRDILEHIPNHDRHYDDYQGSFGQTWGGPGRLNCSTNGPISRKQCGKTQKIFRVL